MNRQTHIRLDTRVLDRMIADLDTNTEGALDAVAFEVEGETKNIIQEKEIIDTGALLNGIHTEKKSRFLRWVSDAVEYGIYNELGTWKMPARPFMVPAVERVGRKIIDKWGRLFR